MNPYVVLGPSVSEMFGRRRLFDRVCRALTKPTPDRLSIVGPKMYGKSVLLSHLAKHFASQRDGYLTSVLINLKHNTPQNDAEFVTRLAKEVRGALNAIRPDLAQELQPADAESLYETLLLVFEHLDAKLLLVFDGFDVLPLGTTISPNLLDQLRELFCQPKCSVVIGSRKRLSELCKTAKSEGSELWKIFADKIDVGVFADSDWDDLWKPFGDRSITIENGAKTELGNWTGGIPPLAVAVLRDLFDQLNNGTTLTRAALVAAAEVVTSAEVVGVLWEDCSGELTDAIAEATRRSVSVDELQRDDVAQAEIRGMATTIKGEFRIASRIIEQFAQKRSPSIQDMTRLFGREEHFNKSMPRLLELRLAQVTTVDADLTRYVRRAIDDLRKEKPKLVLDSARGIVEEALRVIWQTENLDGKKRLPGDWLDTWTKTQGLAIPSGIDPLPTDRGEQLRVVRHIAGNTSYYRRVAQVVSRHTVMLLEQVNSAGSFRAHPHGEDARYGAACAMCLTAIELLASLAADLGAPAT